MATLRAQGGDCEALFREFDLGAAEMAQPDSRVPLELLDGLWQRGAELTGDDCFGLHAAETVGTESFGIVSYLGVTSPTLGDGLARVCRYFRILSDASGYALAVDNNIATLMATQDVPQRWPVRQRVEFTVAVVYLYCQRSVAQPWAATEVFFEHSEPASTGEHQRLFGSPLRFSAGASGFSMPAEALSRPLRTGDPYLVALLESFARQLLDEVSAPTRVAQAVREELLVAGPGGEVGLDSIAKRFGMSPRTLQRRLAEEGTSHQHVLEEVRTAVAKRMLAQGSLGLAEVAFTLGFSEPAAFHRAFKRWTGQTPAGYRRALHKQAGPTRRVVLGTRS